MEALLRLGTFLGVFAVLAACEFWRPRRPLSQPRWQHWLVNLALTAINSLVVRLTVGAVAVSAAVLAQQRGWGLLPLLHVPLWANVLLSLVLLDFAIYLQHVLFHALPLFWRLHMVHHTDLDIDVTSGVRFHPLEMLLSLLYKASLILLLGTHPLAVIAFEVFLNAFSLFQHSNIAFPEGVERLVRTVVITPDLHRIHHSVVVAETNSNFGFSVCFWDRLCGTYRDRPRRPQTTMPLGLAEYREARRLGLVPLLLLPFRPRLPRASSGYLTPEDAQEREREPHGSA